MAVPGREGFVRAIRGVGNVLDAIDYSAIPGGDNCIVGGEKCGFSRPMAYSTVTLLARFLG